MKKLLDFWGGLSLLPRVLLVVALFVVAGRVNVAINGEAPAEAAAVAPAEAARPAGLTMAKYEALSTGISYQQAVAVLGAEGAEASSNDIGDTHTVLYQWNGGFMANMSATFQNDKLVSKAQFGLK